MNSDCQRADLALAARDTGGTSSEHTWPPVARRIRLAREHVGLSEAEVAERAGFVAASEYWDLESYDDEAFTCISVSRLHSIARVFGTTCSKLLFGEHLERPAEGHDFEDVSELLRKELDREQVSTAALSERVGWDLTEILKAPSAVGELNIQGLRDVCKFLGLDWVGVLLASGESRPTTADTPTSCQEGP